MRRRDLFRLVTGSAAAFLLRTYGPPVTVRWRPFNPTSGLAIRRLDPGGYEVRQALAIWGDVRPKEEIILQTLWMVVP